MSFADGTLRSYNTDIATIAGGVAWLNITSYSNTTQRHQSLARRATDHLPTVTIWGQSMRCRLPANVHQLATMAVECREHDAKQALEDSKLPRKREATRVALREKARTLLAQATDIANTYGVAGPQSMEELEAMAERDAAEAVRIRAENEARWERQLAIARALEALPAWRAGAIAFEPVPVRVLPNPVFRIKGDTVESSLGAIVPLSDFRKAVKAALIVRQTGGLPWSPGIPYQIGIYQLNRIDDAGVHVNCHHVTWEEVETMDALINS